MHNLIFAALLFPAWLGSPPVYRDGPVIVSNPVEYSFGREIFFSASVSDSEPLQHVQLVLRDGFSRTVILPVEISPSGGSLLTVRRDLAAQPLFPFASIDYWWEAEFSSGDTVQSDTMTFRYSDDRFEWSGLEKGRAAVEWTDGESGEAEDAADLILLVLGMVSADLETPIPEKISLYLYPRLADLHSALGSGMRGWEGAVSDPASGIILLAAASGAEGRRPLAILLPHEITHILLGEKWKSSYASFPLWLVEGTAAGYEMEARPEAERALREAAAGRSLIPIRTLCGVFPAEENPALLAYAESKSFVAFLKQTYGLDGLRRTMAAYAGGADCLRGTEASTGKSLDALETLWLKTLAAEDAEISPAWALVAAGIILLVLVLAVRGSIQKGSLRFPAKREKRDD
jgi:hypothetical protein